VYDVSRKKLRVTSGHVPLMLVGCNPNRLCAACLLHVNQQPGWRGKGKAGQLGHSLGHISCAVIPLLPLEVEAVPVEGDPVADSRPLGREVVGDAHLYVCVRGGSSGR
jgi:hypothetical protein